MQKLIECVPNFSEGRDPQIIRQITDAIASADGVSLLDVDPGEPTNRTGVTFVGTPKAIVEAAFRGTKNAADWSAGISDRLQCKSQHQIGATSELRRLRCSRTGPGQDARWHAGRESDGRRKRRSDPGSGNVETCESDRVVRGRVRHRPGFDEPDKH